MLNAENLSKSFGGADAVKDLSLELEKGEIVGLLGPNGAGKTTTMKMLSGLLKLDSGSIETENSLRNDVSVAFQETDYNTRITVQEFLDMISVLNERVFPVEEAVSRTGLESDVNTFVEDLSGGTKKKLNIAAGLSKDPKYLLLDEPTAGLDPRAKKKVRESIQNLSEDKAVLVSTHSMEEAEKLCDRVIIIEDGEEVVSGPLSELLSQVGTEFVIKGEGEPEIDLEVEVVYSGDFFEIRTDRPHKVIEELVETGALDSIDNLTVEKPGLEDVFLEVTGRRYEENN